MRFTLTLLPVLECARRDPHERGHLTLRKSEFRASGGDAGSVVGSLCFSKGFRGDSLADETALTVWHELRDAARASGTGEKSGFAANDFFETRRFHGFTFRLRILTSAGERSAFSFLA